MTAKITNSLFFSKKSWTNEQDIVDCQPLIKGIDWFSQMARDENITIDEVEAVLTELVIFFDEKAAGKAEIVAEMKLAEAFREVLQEKRSELIESVRLKR